MARGGALFAQGERASAPSQLGRWLLALGRVAPPFTLARASALVARRPPRTGLAVGDALDGAVFVVRVLAHEVGTRQGRGGVASLLWPIKQYFHMVTGASHHESPH